MARTIRATGNPPPEPQDTRPSGPPVRMLPEPAEVDHDPAIEASRLVRLTEAIYGQERFIAVIGESAGDVVAAAMAELEPAVGFVHLRNVPASPLTLERILSEIGGCRTASPEHELASAADSLASRAGARRRIVLVLDQAQNLSMEALLFLQALPHSTLRDRPVLKILFVADARFWALIGSDGFAGIRECSAEPIILDGRRATQPALRFRQGAAAPPLECAEPVAAVEADFVPARQSSPQVWRRSAAYGVAGVAGIAALFAVVVVRSGSGTLSGDAVAETAAPSMAVHPAPVAAVAVAPAVELATIPATESPTPPVSEPDDLRQKFNDFLSGQGLTHLSAAQRDRLFRQYLASRGRTQVSRADAGR